MDQHQKIAAVLQATTSGIVLLMFAPLLAAGGAMVALVLPYREAIEMGAMVGILGLFACSFISLELLAAIGCLRGWSLARSALLGQ